MSVETLVRAREAGAGSRWARREDQRLVTGAAIYVGDVDRDGQVFARVLRSQIAHGRIRSIETTRAERMPGVLAVLTAADLDVVPVIPLRIYRPTELEAFLQPVIAGHCVRYVGEPLAVVIAVSQGVAEDAAEMIEVDIEPLAAAVSLTEPHVVPIWPDVAGDVLFRYRGGRGDVTAALSHADVVVSASLQTGRDTGLPLETRGLVAEWSPGRTLHLWGPAKFVAFTRDTVAQWFDVPSELVICHHVDVGGAFGVRGELYPEDFLIPWASLRVGRPVKWIEDLNEHLMAINHSRGQLHRVTAGALADGTLVALRVDTRLDFGAYPRPIGGRVAELVVEGLPGPYRWENLDLTCSAVATNKTPTGTMRGPATFDTTFVRERVLDLIAHRLGCDSIELRRVNLIARSELPYRQVLSQPRLPARTGEYQGQGSGGESAVHDIVYDSGDYGYTLERLLEGVAFSRLAKSVEARRRQGELVGWGIACFLAHSGIGREESVRIDVNEEGRIRVWTTGSEIGQGLASMVAKVAAQELSLAEDAIDLRTNETAQFDGGTGTYGSRSTIFVGSAVVDAARRLREAAVMRLLASGRVVTADGLSEADYLEAAPLSVVGRHEASQPTLGFGAHLAVVKVDPESGHITVERLAVVYDCGRALDEESVRGQLRGATIQALGGALYEELCFSPDGQPQTTTMMDFLVPTLATVPPVEEFVVELPGTSGNPLAVKGVGEAGVMGVGGAVSNAVGHALDSDAAALSLPLRPESLVAFLPDMPEPTRRRSRQEAAYDLNSPGDARSRVRFAAMAVAALSAAVVVHFLRRRMRSLP